MEELNTKVFNELKDKYEHFQLGFFNNNHILFIGQNPGIAHTNEDKERTKEVKEKQTFKSFEISYENLIKDSKIGKAIELLIGKNWNHISFTNIVKIATQNNEEPSQELIDLFLPITKSQINLLNPNLVICLGKFAGKQFGLEEFNKFEKIDSTYYVMIPHPSYLMRNNNLEIEYLKIKNSINEWLKYHALIRVKNTKIYYRDIEFNKKSFKNDSARISFNETREESKLKSFDGRNLKISMVLENGKYEAHLQKSDIWHYNNIDNISYCKCQQYIVFDIETEDCNQILTTEKPIISIAFHSSLSKKDFVFVFNPENKKIDSIHNVSIFQFENEKDMLEKFVLVLKKFDIISGWYSNNFDTAYLINRTIKLGINIKQHFDNLRFKIEKDNVFISSDNCIFYDVLEFYKMNTYYDKPPSFSLDAVSKYLFGEEKIKHSETFAEMWKNDINKLIKYNLKDVELTRKINNKVGAINYAIQLQQLCPQDLENVFYNSRTIENLLHHRYWKQHIYFPTKITHIKPHYVGAIVIPPHPGIHKNVAVFDFAAMYTSIYLSFNYSPDTLIGDKTQVENNFDNVLNELICKYPEIRLKSVGKSKDKILNEWILVENDFGQYYFLPKDWKYGILPKLEEEMLGLRKLYKKQRDTYSEGTPEYKIYDDLQGTAKRILNSIYGVVAYEKFIMFNAVIPSSITSTARQLLNYVVEIAEQKGFVSRYGDSVDGKTMLRLVNKKQKTQKKLNQSAYQITIEEFWNKFQNDSIQNNEKQRVDISNENIFTYGLKNSHLSWSRINSIIRHKTTKQRYKITTQKGREVIVTEDHSLIICRNHKSFVIKPTELKIGDEVYDYYVRKGNMISGKIISKKLKHHYKTHDVWNKNKTPKEWMSVTAYHKWKNDKKINTCYHKIGLFKGMTDSEKFAYDILKKYNFVYNQPFGVGQGNFKIYQTVRFVPDFTNIKHKIIIEIDGKSHSEKHIKSRDRIKDKFFISKGFKVFRIRFNQNYITLKKQLLQVITTWIK